MPTPFRHTQPPSPKSATGRTAEVFEQIAVDFGIERPRPSWSCPPRPNSSPPAWALMRESLIAGDGSRTGKELAALGVSLANKCPFCADAHTVLLHATGDHALAEHLARGGTPENEEHARVLDWGEPDACPGPRTSRRTRSRASRHPPTWAPPSPSTSSTASSRPC
jgi:AhpD family alkylhydroperoxidase